MSEQIKVLMIDDNEDDFILTSESMVETSGTRFRFEWAAAFDDGLKVLAENRHDICLVDYSLGRHDGLELTRQASRAGSTIPMIILTGMNDHDLDIEATRAGACDYLVKNQITPPILERSIRYVLAHQAHLREEKRFAETLRRSNGRLAELYETANKFVNNASHEIRTPLTVIREFTSILADGVAGKLNDTQTEYLNIVLDRVDDLRLMVDDMLDISRIEAGLFGVCRCQQDIAKIIEGLKPTIERKAVTSGTGLEIEVEEGLPSVFCDGENIRRVLLNLVVNACKFTGEGGHAKLWVRNSPEHCEVRIGVSDDGPGIAPENLREIFERFRQLGGNAKATSKGFGLGLSIVKELVQANLGEIDVESTLGEGSTFSFSVPVFDLATIVERFVRRIALSDERPQRLSLISVKLAPGHELGPEDLADAEHFLQRQMRRYELLLATGQDTWMICAAAECEGLAQLVRRFRNAFARYNLNRPRSRPAKFDFEVVGTWPSEAAAGKFLPVMQAACDAAMAATAPAVAVGGA